MLNATQWVVAALCYHAQPLKLTFTPQLHTAPTTPMSVTIHSIQYGILCMTLSSASLLFSCIMASSSSNI